MAVPPRVLPSLLPIGLERNSSHRTYNGALGLPMHGLAIAAVTLHLRRAL